MKKGLGKGLDALLGGNQQEEKEDSNINKSPVYVKINKIEPNKNQPRKYHDDESLKELAESIKAHGVIQPIIVKEDGDIYKIIAGERRWRAARIAGIDEIPVIIKDVSEKELLEIALIENIQREDLNPIEEAQAFDNLINEHNVTQEELSKVIGKSRSAIANAVRLLNLDEHVKEYLISGQLKSGHARALLALEDSNKQKMAADIVVNKDLNVRDTEKLVKHLSKNEEPKEKKVNDYTKYFDIEQKLKEIFGTKVSIQSRKKSGKIIIEYYSNDELERIIEMTEKLRY